MKNLIKKWEYEYTYLVRQRKWNFVIKTLVMIGLVDLFSYFMVFSNQQMIMYHDKLFFFVILFLNFFFVFMNFKEAVWEGYKEIQKNEMNQFIPKVLKHKELFTISQITELLHGDQKREFLESLYNSKLRESIKGLKEDGE